MSNAMDRGWLMLILVLAGGLGCQETRFLSCRTRDPRVESRSYDLHDPFPDEDLGPDTFVRPPAFQEPRSDTRKSFDLRNLQASRGVVPPVQAYWDPAAVAAGAPVQPIWRQPPPAVPATTPPGFWDVATPRYNVVPH